jgi:hypothetical protein
MGSGGVRRKLGTQEGAGRASLRRPLGLDSGDSLTATPNLYRWSRAEMMAGKDVLCGLTIVLVV